MMNDDNKKYIESNTGNLFVRLLTDVQMKSHHPKKSWERFFY